MRASSVRTVLLALLVLALLAGVWSAIATAGISHDPAAPIVLNSDTAVSFSLTGSRAGAFAFYAIDYPGDGRVITIDLDLAPGDGVVLNAAGFKVYGQNGFFIGPGWQALGYSDRKTLRWADGNKARWLIQVYNYLDNGTVGFTLRVSGLPTVEPTPTPYAVMRPEQATDMVAHSPNLVSGQLLGNRGGNYHFYKLKVSQPGTPVTLRLYYAPDNALVSAGFGLNVYGPDGVHYAQGGHDVTFVPGVFGTYLVQVYNYLHALNVEYVLSW